MGVVFTGRGYDRAGAFRSRGDYWELIARDAGYTVSEKVEWASQILVSSRSGTKKANAASRLGATVMLYPDFDRHCAARISAIRSEEDEENTHSVTSNDLNPYEVQIDRDGVWSYCSNHRTLEIAEEHMKEFSFTNANRGACLRILNEGGRVVRCYGPHDDEYVIHYRDSRENEPFAPYKSGYSSRKSAMEDYNKLCETAAMDWADLRIVHWSDRHRPDSPKVFTLPTRIAEHYTPPTDAISAESAKRAIQWED